MDAHWATGKLGLGLCWSEGQSSQAGLNTRQEGTEVACELDGIKSSRKQIKIKQNYNPNTGQVVERPAGLGGGDKTGAPEPPALPGGAPVNVVGHCGWVV